MRGHGRNVILSFLNWGLGVTVLMSASYAAESSQETRTFVYKRVGELEIKADVSFASESKTRPVVVWLHGGALINGHRESVPMWLREACQANEHVLVSFDYRLAPETQLPAIIEDLEDSLSWLHAEGPKLFRADVTRVAVVGGSAGGYLTLTAGFRAKPRPTALVALWGYGDLVGDWFSRPSPHAAHHSIKVSEEEARRQVQGPAISDARQRAGNGAAFYQFCRQRGVWPQEVAGWDPHREPEKFYPYMALKNVSADYPPTLMIHGDKDTDVPFEQSALVAAELKKHGVTHRLLRIRGAEHGLAGADREVVESAYREATEFLKTRLAVAKPAAASE